MKPNTKKIQWPGMTPDDRCGCEICAGRAALAAEDFKPRRFWHEVAEKPPEAVSAPDTPAPVPKPARARREAPTGTLDERIAAIQARCDIGPGLKGMQIKNLLRKAS